MLLGVSQGLTWSTTVIMKIDLVGPARRGLAMGFNEAAGYAAVAVTALATGFIAQAHGLRPAPFFLGIAYAALGLGLSTLAVKETRGHARLEAAGHVARADGRHDHLHGELTNRQVFTLTSFREPALSAASQAGLVNNLNDGLAWGLFPIFFAGAGLSVGRIGILAAIYPAVWGLGQLVTGGLSDRMGRKWLIAGGMLLQAVGARDDRRRRPASAAGRSAPALLGAGTAMVYPTLLAAIGDVAHPSWRARSVGVYRLWRDGGLRRRRASRRHRRRRLGVRAAIWVVAALTAALRASSSPSACTRRTTGPQPSRPQKDPVGGQNADDRGGKVALFPTFAAVGGRAVGWSVDSRAGAPSTPIFPSPAATWSGWQQRRTSRCAPGGA